MSQYDNNEEKDQDADPLQLNTPPIAPPGPQIKGVSKRVSKNISLNEDEIDKFNKNLEENFLIENNINIINKKNNDEGIISNLNDVWKGSVKPIIKANVPQINFIYKIILAGFVYVLLKYVLDKILFFYDLTSDIGYVYYVWITILIFLFIILPIKSVYFDYLN